MSDPPLPLDFILDSGRRHLFDVTTKAAGPAGRLPLSPHDLVARPSGDVFGWTQNDGMVALVTDARFSGVSTGPCIGHVAPEALAGGPIGRLRDGDLVRVIIDTRQLRGSVDLVRAATDGALAPADDELARRTPHPDLAPDPDLPDDTRLWAALQDASGGPWGGAVYDVDRILRLLEAGRQALE